MGSSRWQEGGGGGSLEVFDFPIKLRMLFDFRK